MACNKQEMINDTSKRIQRALKKANSTAVKPLSNSEIRDIANADAIVMVDASIAKLKEEDLSDYVDNASALPAGAVSELNAAKPKKGNTPITVGEINNNKIYYKYPNGTKTYSVDPKGITLDQKDAQSVIDKYTATPLASKAVAANAVHTDPLPVAEQVTVEVSREVQALNEQYISNPTKENKAKLMNAEIAHGYRNAKGESLVKLTNRTLIGSSNTPMTNDQIEEYLYDEDGTMTKSENINKVLTDIDKKNAGENFNQEQSTKLDNVLGRIATIINEVQDKGVRLRLDNLKTLMEANGEFNHSTQDITVYVEDRGAGNKYRNNFTMTNQEVYVHELVHSVMDFMFKKKDRNVVRDVDFIAMESTLKELYSTARKESTWETLLPGYADESIHYTEHQIKQAQAKWEYIFNNKEGYGLHEFMAALLTNQMFSEAMSGISSIGTKKKDINETMLEKVQRLFINLLTRIAGFATNRKDNSITESGTELIFNIMRANSHAASVAATNSTLKIEEAVDAVTETIVAAVEKSDAKIKKVLDPIITVFDEIATDDTMTEIARHEEMVQTRKDVNKILAGVKKGESFVGSLFNIISVTSKLLRVLPKIYRAKQLVGNTKEARAIANQYAKMFNTVLTTMHLAEDGIIRGVIGNFVDRPGLYTALTDMILKLTHSVDGMRETAYEQVLERSNEWFGDILINNDRLNKRNNEALTDVVLRTDIQALGVEGLQELLMDSSKVDAQIATLSNGMSKQVLKDAKSSASYMVTGVGLITNARNITSGFGTDTVSAASDSDVANVDKLISLLALQMTSKEAKGDMLHFLNGAGYTAYKNTLESKWGRKLNLTRDTTMNREEYTKQIRSGVENFMAHAHGLQVRSAEELAFTPHNIIKGYMKETYDKSISLEFAPLSDRKDMEANGYTFIRETGKVIGSTTPYAMYTTKNAAVKRANGALGLQDRKARGFTLLDIVDQESSNLPAASQIDTVQKAVKFKALLATTLKQYNANKLDVNMHPMYDKKGNVINFRITMPTVEKKQYLNMETSGTQNLARSYSTMGTATATEKHNEAVIDMLQEDYEANYKIDPDAYVVIRAGALSAEAFGLKEVQGKTSYEKLWARLPQGTKKYATAKFGNKEMIVRKDMLEAVFGEDDFMATNIKATANLSVKTRTNINTIEKLWQDTMQIAKSNIVIKTPEVLFGNVWSNAKILAYIGVHPVKGFKLLMTGIRELKRYGNDKKELGDLLRRQDSGLSVSTSRIKELKEEIKNNTVAPLIDAGLFQSIVEDVSTITDNNRVSNWFNDKTDQFITNETANTAIQYLFLTQKTKPFQQLLKATQTSDFYFRYAQYYNAVDNKGQSKEQALREAIDNYINYEAPLNKYVRYGDSMGPFFFIRYFTRIQRVIKRIVKDNPSRVAADVGIQHFITGDTPDILDAHFFDKNYSQYNPFAVLGRLWEVVSPPGIEVAALAV